MPPEHQTPSSESQVSLRQITAETVRAICNLEVLQEQKGFVAPNSVSIAQAYFEPDAWFRAIYADEIPVGFVMLYIDAEKSEYFLWRFMIDAHYQKLGFGSQALNLVIEHVRSLPGAVELRTSCVPRQGGPEPFYAKHSFERTGKMMGDEVELRLSL
jgi:diamine N-acetyltransferase